MVSQEGPGRVGGWVKSPPSLHTFPVNVRQPVAGTEICLHTFPGDVRKESRGGRAEDSTLLPGMCVRGAC